MAADSDKTTVRYELPGELRGKLRALRVALRLRLAAEGACWLLLALIAAVFATLAIDYTLRLDERILRMIVAAVALGGVSGVAWLQLLRPLGVEMPPRDLSLLVERRYPQLEDRLASAVAFARGAGADTSGGMLARMFDEARRLACPLDFNGVIERRRARRVGLLALAGTMLLAGFTVWQAPVMRRWFQRNVLFVDAAVAAWPQDTYLRVRGGPHFTVLRGEDLRITVGVAPGSVAPDEITLHRTLASIGRTSREVIARAGDSPARYEKLIRNIHEPFTFYVTGGDDRTDQRDPHRVHVIDPPTVESVSFTVTYPRYAGRKSEHYGSAQAAPAVPFGGTVIFRAATNKPVTDATIRLGNWQTSAATGEQTDFSGPVVWRSDQPPGRSFEASFVVEGDNAFADKTINVRLRDADKHTNGRGQDFPVRIVPDEPPTVTVAKIGGLADLRSVTPDAVLPVRITAGDVYGLAVRPIPAEWTSLVSEQADKADMTPREVREAFAAPALSVRLIGAGDEAASPRPVKALVDRRERSRVVVRDEVDFAGAVEAGRTARLAVAARDARPKELDGPGRTVSEPLNVKVVERSELAKELFRRQKRLAEKFSGAIELQTTAYAKTVAAGDLDDDGRIAAPLRASARSQRLVADECGRAASTFSGLLDEMTYNHIGDSSERAAISIGIAGPLESLSRRGVNVAVEIERLAAGERPSSESVARVAAEQKRILDEMKAIAGRMEKFRTLQAMSERVERMIDWLERLREEIDEQREKGIGELLGPETRPSERD